MTGDLSDMLARIKAVLPRAWFPDATPVLDAMLTGVAAGWAWVYSLLAYVQAQTRVATATDVWLDVIALDYFGSGLQRRPAETDSTYRQRIHDELLRERGTRAAIVSILIDLTGRTPTIFEPARTSDTGGYTLGGIGYGVGGGWGSLVLPFQCFVTAYRASGTGVGTVAGWGSGAGGYGEGAIEYAGLAMIEGQTSDAEIAAAVASVLPATAIAWLRISN
jgi:hypothetical protein